MDDAADLLALLPEVQEALSETFDGVECSIGPGPVLSREPFRLPFNHLGKQVTFVPDLTCLDDFDSTNLFRLNLSKNCAVFSDGLSGCCLELAFGAGKDWKTPLIALFDRLYPNKWAFFVAEVEHGQSAFHILSCNGAPVTTKGREDTPDSTEQNSQVSSPTESVSDSASNYSLWIVPVSRIFAVPPPVPKKTVKVIKKIQIPKKKSPAVEGVEEEGKGEKKKVTRIVKKVVKKEKTETSTPERDLQTPVSNTSSGTNVSSTTLLAGKTPSPSSSSPMIQYGAPTAPLASADPTAPSTATSTMTPIAKDDDDSMSDLRKKLLGKSVEEKFQVNGEPRTLNGGGSGLHRLGTTTEILSNGNGVGSGLNRLGSGSDLRRGSNGSGLGLNRLGSNSDLRPGSNGSGLGLNRLGSNSDILRENGSSSLSSRGYTAGTSSSLRPSLSRKSVTPDRRLDPIFESARAGPTRTAPSVGVMSADYGIPKICKSNGGTPADVPFMALQCVMSRCFTYEHLCLLREVHPHWDEIAGQLLNTGYYKLLDRSDKLLMSLQRKLPSHPELHYPTSILTNIQVHILNPVDIMRAVLDEGVCCFPYGVLLDKCFLLLDKIEAMLNDGDQPRVDWESVATLAKRAQLHYKDFLEKVMEERLGENLRLKAAQRLIRLDSFMVETQVNKLEKESAKTRDDMKWDLEQMSQQNTQLRRDNRQLRQDYMKLEARVDILEGKFKTLARLLS